VRQIRSVNKLLEIALGAKLDDELFFLLSHEESRNILRTLLVESYFAPEIQHSLIEQSTINREAYWYSQELLEKARRNLIQEALIDEEKYPIRDQGFRRAIVTAYNHRCAICGIRMLTPAGHSAVNAAHIIPWSVSHNDSPRNGIALCRLCHWSFDEGLMGISPKYKVIISFQITSNNNVPGHLVTLSDRIIIGPDEKVLWPDLDTIAWHRQKVFIRQ
jgi:putative restriction endonuclease